MIVRMKVYDALKPLIKPNPTQPNPKQTGFRPSSNDFERTEIQID